MTDHSDLCVGKRAAINSPHPERGARLSIVGVGGCRAGLLSLVIAMGCRPSATSPVDADGVPPPKSSSAGSHAGGSPSDPQGPARKTAPDAAIDSRGFAAADDAQRTALARGKQALAAGQADRALALFETVLEGPMSGASVSGGLAAAELLEARNEVEAARAIYKTLLERARRVPEVHLLAGRFYWRQHDETRAIEVLRRAIRLEPELLPAYMTLGVVLGASGRSDEAARMMLDYEVRLGQLAKRAVDPSAPLDDRLAVADLFATISDDRATTALITLVRDREPKLRMAAASALAHDASPEALVALAEAALAEPDPVTRGVLAWALGQAKEQAQAAVEAPAPSEARGAAVVSP